MTNRVGRPPRPKNLMTLKEIRELLVLKEWTRDELAGRLGIVRNTIDKWFCVREDQQRHPSPDHVLKMRTWLTDARQTAYNGISVSKPSRRREAAGVK